MFEFCEFKCYRQMAGTTCDHSGVLVVRPEERTRSGLCFAAKHNTRKVEQFPLSIGANID